jgi:hypothetical protein
MVFMGKKAKNFEILPKIFEKLEKNSWWLSTLRKNGKIFTIFDF